MVEIVKMEDGRIMLLESYQVEILNSKCMPGSTGVHCFAHLDQDVSEAIPYLNASLGGFTFTRDISTQVSNKCEGFQSCASFFHTISLYGIG